MSPTTTPCVGLCEFFSFINSTQLHRFDAHKPINVIMILEGHSKSSVNALTYFFSAVNNYLLLSRLTMRCANIITLYSAVVGLREHISEA